MCFLSKLAWMAAGAAIALTTVYIAREWTSSTVEVPDDHDGEHSLTSFFVAEVELAPPIESVVIIAEEPGDIQPEVESEWSEDVFIGGADLSEGYLGDDELTEDEVEDDPKDDDLSEDEPSEDDLSEDESEREETPRKFKMTMPVIESRGEEATLWQNFHTICQFVDRKPSHISSFVCSKLSTTGSRVGVAKRQLLFNSCVSLDQIVQVLKLYITEFVLCWNCKSPDTVLNSKTGQLICSSCQRHAAVKLPANYHKLTWK
jgi:translation initiation factor 2 subunit 2